VSTQPVASEDVHQFNMRASEARLLDRRQEPAEDFQLSKPKAEEKPAARLKGSPQPKRPSPESKRLVVKKTIFEPK